MAHYLLKRLCPLVLAAFAVTSCVNDPAESTPTEGTQVTFSIRMPGVKNPASRALDAQDEDKVETADVYVFDRTTQKLVDIGYGRSITEDSTNPLEIICNFSVTLQKADNRDVTVVTNARKIIDDAFPGGVPIGTDKAEFARKVVMALPAGGWNANPGSTGYASIPMWGERININIDGSTALTGTNSIKITRMMARMNVAVAQSLVDAGKFKLNSVRVYNYNTYGLLVPDDDKAEGTWQDPTPYAQDPSLPQTAGWVDKPAILYNDVQNNGQCLYREIYLFEAEKGKAPAADGLWIKNPCIVIGGYFDGSPTETFYRIDIVQKQQNGTATYLHILRNNSYNITITDVNGPGKGDEDEAYNTLPVNIDAQVVAWNDHDMNDHLSDGQYQLTVDKNMLTFYDEGREQSMKVYTDYPYGWEIEQSTLPAWLVGKITPDNDNSATAVEVEIKPGPINLIDPSIQPGDTLKYSFFIAAGSIRKEIFIQQINEPELTITLSENSLTFRRGAPTAKSVTVTIYPTGLDVYISQMGEITWVAGGFPDSPLPLANPYIFHPEALADAIQSTINTEVTFTVMKDGKIASDKLTIYQLANDILFNASTFTYPAAGGEGVAGGVYFTYESDADWMIGSFSDPDSMLGGYDTSIQPAGKGLTYGFKINPNPDFRQRHAEFTVVSDDPEFSQRKVPITQNYTNPYIRINPTTTLNLGNTENGSDATLNVYSNARWKYTTGTQWANAVASVSGVQAGVESGSANANNEDTQTITFHPVKYSAATTTPAAGTTFTVTATLESTNHDQASKASQTVTLVRTVPSYFQYTGVSHNSIPKEGARVSVYANTNNAWSISNYGVSLVSQDYAVAWGSQQLDENIPANNSWANRSVTVTYAGNNLWTTVTGTALSVIQPSHTMGTPTLSHSSIAGGGDVISVSLPGDYPDTWVEAAALWGSTIIASAYSIGKQLTLTIPNNGSSGPRDIVFAYRRYVNGVWEANWIPFNTLQQAKGNIVLSSGRIVANNYLDRIQITFSELLGVDDADIVPGIGADYIVKNYTGCGDYYEKSDMSDKRQWRVPTVSEAQEMQALNLEGSFICGNRYVYTPNATSSTGRDAYGFTTTWVYYTDGNSNHLWGQRQVRGNTVPAGGWTTRCVRYQ